MPLRCPVAGCLKLIQPRPDETGQRSLAHREKTVRWFGVLVAVAPCGLALAFGWRSVLWFGLLASRPLKVLLLILVGGTAAAVISNRRRSPSLDGKRFMLALVGYGCSLVAPLVFFGLVAVTSRLTGTSNHVLHAAFAGAQLALYVVTTGWFAWHQHWLPTAALVVALFPLVGLHTLAAFYAACAFFSECI